jgi:hypothetical protein
MDRTRRFALAGASLWLFTATSPSVEANESLYAPPSWCEVKRAGYPRCISKLAAPSNTCRYDGYYVGGGAPTYCNAGRCADQGTWGWDFVGKCLPRVVELNWWHHPHEQGGTGSYEPDGPRCSDILHPK